MLSVSESAQFTKSRTVENVAVAPITPEIRRPQKPHEREVGVPSMWPQRGGIFHKSGMALALHVNLIAFVQVPDCS